MLQRIPPAWREWLKQTRYPILRQLASFARVATRVKRLGRTQTAVEQLQARCAALERQIQGLVSEHVAALNARADLLDTKDHLMSLQHAHLTSQLDLLKSAGEVPAEWLEEFACWKQENPLPETPRISICVATWNRGQLLTERCLASLLRQTYRHIEVIVVGDACTDDTAERIAALGDPRVRFVNLPQRGRYPDDPMRRWMVAGTVPMNHALGLCTGDYITHLDDDDEHDPTRLEKLVVFARDNDLDFVWHPFWLQSPSGQWEVRPCEELRLGSVTTSSIFYRSWLARIGWNVNAHMLAEPGDWNRLRKFAYLGVKAARFPEPLLHHYVERSQLQSAA
jgi:hypothetical protein